MKKQRKFLVIFVLECAVALVLLTHAGKANAYRLPDTGETTCYNSSGVVTACPSVNPMSFIDNGNGTVTDNNTGLLWQKLKESKSYNWYKASGTYDGTDNINSDNVCANYGSGWRLPAISELMSIVNFSVQYPGPTIQATYFPDSTYNIYWSVTQCAYTPKYAWGTNFMRGSLSRIYMTDEWSVRCVRGTENNPTPRFNANGDGTVTDNKTGLMWQRCTHGQDHNSTCTGTAIARTWSQALSYCKGLLLPSTSINQDWRLPNIRELQSLADYTKVSPTIDSTYFPNTVLTDYWSSTTVAGYPNLAWDLDFSLGDFNDLSGHTKSDALYVRCVRTGPLGPLDNLVRLMRNLSEVDTYPTIKEAYAAAMDGDVVEAQALDSAEVLTLARDIMVEIKGGYDSGFATNPDATTVVNLTISSGTVTVENMILR